MNLQLTCNKLRKMDYKSNEFLDSSMRHTIPCIINEFIYLFCKIIFYYKSNSWFKNLKDVYDIILIYDIKITFIDKVKLYKNFYL